MVSWDAVAVQNGMQDRLDQARRNYKSWKAHALKMEAKNDELLERLAMRECHISGLNAIINGFKHYHPDSIMLKDTGKRYKESGNIKTNARLFYEKAHDLACKKVGITDPLSVRVD